MHINILSLVIPVGKVHF